MGGGRFRPLVADRGGGEHGQAVGVGQVQRDAVAGRGQPGPHRARAGGVDRDVGPGGRGQRGGAGVGDEHRVQCGGKQGRVDREAVGGQRFGQGEFGVQLRAAAPQAAQGLTEVVAPGQVDRFRAGRRPFAGRGGGCGDARAEPAGGVLGPGRAVGVGPGVDADLALSVVGGRADDDLDTPDLVLRQRDRSVHSELTQGRAAHVITGTDRQFDQRGGRQNGDIGDDVVGQPRVQRPRDPAGQHHAAGLGGFDDGA